MEINFSGTAAANNNNNNNNKKESERGKSNPKRWNKKI